MRSRNAQCIMFCSLLRICLTVWVSDLLYPFIVLLIIFLYWVQFVQLKVNLHHKCNTQQLHFCHWPPHFFVSQEKVDCITVNCEPVKAAIDDLIQRLFDMLLLSLRKSIQGKHRHLDFPCFFQYVIFVAELKHSSQAPTLFLSLHQ